MTRRDEFAREMQEALIALAREPQPREHRLSFWQRCAVVLAGVLSAAAGVWWPLP